MDAGAGAAEVEGSSAGLTLALLAPRIETVATLERSLEGALEPPTPVADLSSL